MANITADYLKDETPKIDSLIFFNNLYLYFDFYKSYKNLYYKPQILDVMVYEYQRGATYPENSLLVDVQRYQYNLNDIKNDHLDKKDFEWHHYQRINNTFYKIEVRTGIFNSSEKGEQLFYSKPEVILLNNTFPLIEDMQISQYIKGELKDSLYKNKRLNIFHNITNLSHLNTGDIFSKKSRVWKKFKIIETSNEVINTSESLDKYTNLLLSFIFDNEYFSKTINDYFENDVPDEIKTVKFIINGSENYTISITGNFKEILKDFSIND